MARALPRHLALLRERFDIELTVFLEDRRELVASLHPDVGLLADEVVELTLAGGKRLRPAFAYWGFRGGGGGDGTDIIRACVALELLHTFALLHDDIMDGSPTRRARAAAWVRFTDLHAREGWRGDPGHFGVSAAILAGDLALMWADEMLACSRFPAERLMAGFDPFTMMRVEVTAGQYLDLLEAHRGHTDEATARRICTLKSGLYTVERPLHIGLALAGGLDHLRDVYTAYGNPLGQAFQLRDDVLGVFGDPDETGKPSDDDLREGKETVLVAKARAKARPSDRRTLDNLLGARDLTEDGISELRRILVESRALADTEDLIASLAGEAAMALDGTVLEGGARDALISLAEFVASRDT